MRFDILTLFPQIFSGYLTQSILSKAIEKDFVGVNVHDMRDWAEGPHNKIDDRPFGGGPGMILMVEPVVRAVRAVEAMDQTPATTIMLTPTGRKLDQPLIEDLAQRPRLLTLCGRYEGFDQRVTDILQPMEISIGDYILNGGEVAAMVLVDAIVRMIPGVLGDEFSNFDDSFSRGNRLLEYRNTLARENFRGMRSLRCC